MSEPTILVVEDDQALSEALQDTLNLAGYQVVTAANGREALAQLETHKVDLIVSDINMPQMDGEALLKRVRSSYPNLAVVLMTAYGTIQQAVAAMREGAVDYMVKPFEAEVLVNMVSRYVGEPSDETEMVMEDPASIDIAAMAQRVAESDATIMITGESGSGKEVLARYIHNHSKRAAGPFVAINCAAIPENMLEATLFGYEKGAFTGAYKSSPGKFELAQGGTLLLDEISEMDLGLQAKLLRVLQEKEVERLGGNNLIQLDVRVLATSNRDMLETVAEGKFREDLYYRLNVFPLHLAPLRDRVADIIPLANRLLEKHARALSKAIPKLSDWAQQKLLEHDWPGNVRELDNVMQRALILATGDEIDAAAIHFSAAAQLAQPKPAQRTHTATTVSESNDSLNGDLRQREWDIILNTIRAVGGSRKLTAERLGISQRTLRYKLAKMREAGIQVPEATQLEMAG